MHAVVHALIWILEIVFAVAAAVCLFTVIPMTAYRLFLVIFEAGDDHGHPEHRAGK